MRIGFPEEADGAFPVLGSSRSPSSSPRKTSKRSSSSKKLACALQALKCSSRADKDGDDCGFPRYPSDGTFPSLSDGPPLPAEQGEWLADFDDDDHNLPERYFSSPVDLDEALDEHEAVEAAGAMVTATESPGSPLFRENPHDPEETIEETEVPRGDKTTVDMLLAEDEIVEEVAPIEDSSDLTQQEEEEDDDEPQQENLAAMPPERIASEDTHDTPQVSNRDPNKPPTPEPNDEEAKLGEFCHKYFQQQSPPRQVQPVFHSEGSLGDSITPMDSPVVEDDHIFQDDEDSDVGCDNRIISTDTEEAIRMLQLPPTTPLSTSTIGPSNSGFGPYHRPASSFDSRSMLFGEHISIVASSPSSQHREEIRLVAEAASMTIGGKELIATIPTLTKRGANPKVVFPTNDTQSDSSFSSVSSFRGAKESAQSSSKPKKTTRRNYRVDDSEKKVSATTRPFFWRSHPNVTVQSYDFQQPQKPHIRKVKPKLEAVHVMDSFSDFQSSVGGNSPRSSPLNHNEDEGDNDDDGDRRKSSNSYAPYIHPAMVRKMWNDSQPFQMKINSNWQRLRTNSERHPQGPPSTRSSQHHNNNRHNPFVQSLASFAKLPVAFARPGNNSRRSSGNNFQFS